MHIKAENAVRKELVYFPHSTYCNRKAENKNYTISEKDNITEENLLKLYDVFLDKLENSVYGKRLGTQAVTLKNGKTVFVELGIEDKCSVLTEILHLFQCQSGAANLSIIGGPGQAGIVKINKNIADIKSICIINQSPTGLYEQEIDLKTV